MSYERRFKLDGVGKTRSIPIVIAIFVGLTNWFRMSIIAL